MAGETCGTEGYSRGGQLWVCKGEEGRELSIHQSGCFLLKGQETCSPGLQAWLGGSLWLLRVCPQARAIPYNISA